MKPTKQTVYLPVKVEDVVNNNEGWCIAFVPKEGYQYGRFNKSENPVFRSNIDGKIKHVEQEFLLPEQCYFFTPEQLNEYTQKIIKQALETAAEKTEKEWCSDGYSTGMWKEVVDKQSITNTFEETFKKFEV